MTKVSPAVSPTTTNPCDYFSFFSKEEDRVIEKHQKRELPPITNPAASCDFNLFFGFFFDGTRNNYNSCTRNEGYSNVARLYDTYPGQVVPDVISGDPSWQDYPHFFKVYVPGVHSDVCGDYLPKEQGRGSDPKGGRQAVAHCAGADVPQGQAGRRAAEGREDATCHSIPHGSRPANDQTF